VGLERLVLKREDLNPTGSHKDRGAAFQVSALRSQRPDLRWLVISSSGNAAIAAAAYAGHAAMSLAAFVAPGTARGKLQRLLQLGALVLVTPKAITIAEHTADRLGLPNLRPSTDPLAVQGFQTLGWELAEDLAPDWAQDMAREAARLRVPIEAVFTFASSGTTLVALGRAFARSGEVVEAAWEPACHVVQGTGAHTIAGRFDPRPVTEGRGRVGALGARKTRRLGEAVRLVAGTGGSGWVITDREAGEAQDLLRAHGIDTSLEGAACVAAARRAADEQGLRSAVVLLTGRPRGERTGDLTDEPNDVPIDVATDEPTGEPSGDVTAEPAGESADQDRLRVVSSEAEAVAIVSEAMGWAGGTGRARG
jgi:threonine synthase